MQRCWATPPSSSSSTRWLSHPIQWDHCLVASPQTGLQVHRPVADVPRPVDRPQRPPPVVRRRIPVRVLLLLLQTLAAVTQTRRVAVDHVVVVAAAADAAAVVGRWPRERTLGTCVASWMTTAVQMRSSSSGQE